MRLYIAGPWADREMVERESKQYLTAGHTITHPWWEHEGEYEDHAAMQRFAVLDVWGVRDADAMVVYDTQKSEGKAVEQGIAIALHKPIVAVGVVGSNSLNIFHHLPNYIWVADTAAALTILNNLPNGVRYGKRN